MKNLIQTLANEVEAGRSRRSIQKEHGLDVLNQVRAELNNRNQLSNWIPQTETHIELHHCAKCDKEMQDTAVDYCESCAREIRVDEWRSNTENEVAKIAKKYGWKFDNMNFSGGVNTGSRYYELTKNNEIIKLRISDHGSAYCSEDVSLAFEPSGDDHSIDYLIALMQK